MAVVGRTLEARASAWASSPSPTGPRRAVQGAGQAEPVLGRDGRQHGFHDQPLHGRPQDAQRRRYTPGAAASARPRCHRLQPALPRGLPGVPVVLGGIEGSLRRIAHYDYWSDKVRRSIVVTPSATCCCTAMPSGPGRGGAPLAAQGEPVDRSPTCAARRFWRHRDRRKGWFEIDSTDVDTPGPVKQHINPYQTTSDRLPELGKRARRSRPGRAGDANAFNAAASGGSAIEVRQVPPRIDRDPPAILRAGQGRSGALRPRQPRAAPRDQPRQRRALVQAWQRRRRATFGSTRRRFR